MLPRELVDYILRLADLPAAKELADYGSGSVGPRMFGTYSHAHLRYAREARERTTWRAMRRAAGLPTTKNQLKAWGRPLDARLLKTIEVRDVGDAPVLHEACVEWRMMDAVWTFRDQQERLCIYASLHEAPQRLRAWLEAYGLWEQVECYRNDPRKCYRTGPQWRCRHEVFILRL